VRHYMYEKYTLSGHVAMSKKQQQMETVIQIINNKSHVIY